MIAVVGDTVRFQLKLTYYGDASTLVSVNITDYLPDCLEYADNADPEETAVSGDNKTIWWNFSGVTITNGEPFIVEFDALVTEIPECCECCLNEAEITFRECGEEEDQHYEDTLCLIIEENRPPDRPIIEGDTTGQEGDTLNFEVLADNDQETQVWYFIDWGDGTDSGWIGPYSQGVWTPVTNSWSTAGEYTVKAKAKDSHDAESDWSNSIIVEITSGPPEDVISIEEIKGGLGITVTVRNNGLVDIPDAPWYINITSRIEFLDRINFSHSGNITLDASDDTELPKVTIMGLGFITVAVEVSADGYNTASASRNGIVLGPLVIFTS